MKKVVVWGMAVPSKLITDSGCSTHLHNHTHRQVQAVSASIKDTNAHPCVCTDIRTHTHNSHTFKCNRQLHKGKTRHTHTHTHTRCTGSQLHSGGLFNHMHKVQFDSWRKRETLVQFILSSCHIWSSCCATRCATRYSLQQHQGRLTAPLTVLPGRRKSLPAPPQRTPQPSASKCVCVCVRL